MTQLPEDDKPTLKERPNKTRLKKEAHALTEFSKRLAELSLAQREQLHLPEPLERALENFIKTKSFVAKKRHGQYLGKVMRELPEEEQAQIIKKAEHFFKEQQTMSSSFHQVEHWRHRLLNEDGNKALTEFIANYPETDRQQLRHLIQKAKKDLSTSNNFGNGKLLFRFLRAIIE